MDDGHQQITKYHMNFGLKTYILMQYVKTIFSETTQSILAKFGRKSLWWSQFYISNWSKFILYLIKFQP
jgi:hypothetical protein